jgi:hypothetical protein
MGNKRECLGLVLGLLFVAVGSSHADVVANEFYDLDDTVAPIEPPPGWTLLSGSGGIRSGSTITAPPGGVRFYTRAAPDISGGQAWSLEAVLNANALGFAGEAGARMWAQFEDSALLNSPPVGERKFRRVELRLLEGVSGDRRLVLIDAIESFAGVVEASLNLDWADQPPAEAPLRVRLKRQQTAGGDYIVIQAESSRTGPLPSDPLNWDDPADLNPDPDTANSQKVPLTEFSLEFLTSLPNEFGFGHTNNGTGLASSTWGNIHVTVADDANTQLPYWPSVPAAPILAVGGSSAPDTVDIHYDVDLGPPGAYLANDVALLSLDYSGAPDIRSVIDPSNTNGGLLHEDFESVASGQTVTGAATVEDASGRPRPGPPTLLQLPAAVPAVGPLAGFAALAMGATGLILLRRRAAA